MAAKNTSLAREAGSSEQVMATLGNLLGINKEQKDVIENHIQVCKCSYLKLHILQFQSISNEFRRLKKEHETLLDVVDGLRRENDELIARNNIGVDGANIDEAHIASLQTALEEHVMAQSELFEILELQGRQRSVSIRHHASDKFISQL